MAPLLKHAQITLQTTRIVNILRPFHLRRLVNVCAVLCLLQPIALKRKDRTEPTVVSEPYNPVLAFETNEVGAFDDTVPGLNSIHHTANSAFIAGIKEQLKEKRFISDVQRV